MDIRLRNRTKILRALAGAVLCLCAAAMLLFYPAFEEAGQDGRGRALPVRGCNAAVLSRL